MRKDTSNDLMQTRNFRKKELEKEIYRVTDANKQKDHVHIRIMVTRGLKPTPYQNPKVTIGRPTVVIIPERKESSSDKTGADARVDGITLFTVHVRRGRPDVQDPAWNSHSKLNCISACIQVLCPFSLRLLQ